MRNLMEESNALDVTVPEEEPISLKVKAIDWWLKRASNAFLKRGTALSLLQLLQAKVRPLSIH